MNTIHFHSCSQLNWMKGNPIVRLYEVLSVWDPLGGQGLEPGICGNCNVFYSGKTMCHTPYNVACLLHTHTHTHTQQGGCGATAEKKDIVDNCPLLKFYVGSFRTF